VGEDAGTFMAVASRCARHAYWVSVDPCIVEIVLLSVCGAADIFGEACNTKVVLLMVGCAKAFREACGEALLFKNILAFFTVLNKRF
jgi:hypothetical protein